MAVSAWLCSLPTVPGTLGTLIYHIQAQDTQRLLLRFICHPLAITLCILDVVWSWRLVSSEDLKLLFSAQRSGLLIWGFQAFFSDLGVSKAPLFLFKQVLREEVNQNPRVCLPQSSFPFLQQSTPQFQEVGSGLSISSMPQHPSL